MVRSSPVRGVVTASIEDKFDDLKTFVFEDGTTVEQKFSDASSVEIFGKSVEKIIDSEGNAVWQKPDYLCFTAEEAGATIEMSGEDFLEEIKIETSFDQVTWTVFTPTKTTITLENIGDKVYFRGKNKTLGWTWPQGEAVYATYNVFGWHFVIPKKVKASGDVTSLLNQTGGLTELPYFRIPVPDSPRPTFESPATFHELFANCAITSVPKLPATNLTAGCYRSMFANCVNLTVVPELNANNLTTYCYYLMFNGCTALTEIKLDYIGGFTDAPSSAFTNWVRNVSSTGDFYYNGTDATRGEKAIPTGWTVHTF